MPQCGVFVAQSVRISDRRGFHERATLFGRPVARLFRQTIGTSGSFAERIIPHVL